MQTNSTTDAAPLFAGEEAWFDPIEAELRERVRGFLQEMIEEEATAALGRGRYQRGAAAGYRNGMRSRRLLGSFGTVEIAVPRARLLAPDGTSREWRSAVLPRYARMTRQVRGADCVGLSRRHWDGSGLVLVWKQLSHGTFRWPPMVDGVLKLSEIEYAALFDGVDWTRVQATKRIPTPTVAA